MPRLLEILSKHNIQASVPVLLENMGRHLWRLGEATVFVEDAALKRGIALWLGRLSGPAGTAWPGKEIGHANADIDL